jgi:hypothetical protein
MRNASYKGFRENKKEICEQNVEFLVLNCGSDYFGRLVAENSIVSLSMTALSLRKSSSIGTFRDTIRNILYFSVSLFHASTPRIFRTSATVIAVFKYQRTAS